MKNQIKKSCFLLSFMLLALLTSCRSEDDLSIDSAVESAIEANSTIANLISRVVLNDGSHDNIIDNASNLSVLLPVTVTANSINLEIIDEEGYQNIEDIFDLSDVDVDTLVITFPITVMFSNFSTLVVNSSAELQALSTTENEVDNDIECINFEYPITASTFNESKDSIDSITINNDYEMYSFIKDLNQLTAVTINFPIKIIFSDGVNLTINTIQDLENAILSSDNTCDEDDDYDYNDDDIVCTSCSTAALQDIFAQCSEWTVDKLRKNNASLTNDYMDYIFTFNNDGTITVLENNNTYTGTWGSNLSGQDIEVIINVVGLPVFNNTWLLENINMQSVEKQVELKLGIDRLRFGSMCTN